MKTTTLFSFAVTLLLTLASSFNAYSQDYVEVGNGSYENLFIPVTATLSNSVTQQLYLASEIGSTPMEINAIAFHHKPYSSTTVAATRNIKVYLSPTQERYITQENEWLYVAESDLVYQGTFNLPADDEWVKIDFSRNFQYDGHSNIVVTVIDNTGQAASGGSHVFYATLYDNDDFRAMVGSNSGSSSYGIEILNTVTGIAAVSCANIRFYKEEPVVLSTSTWYAFTGACSAENYNTCSLASFTMQDAEHPQNLKDLTQYHITAGEYVGGKVYFVDNLTDPKAFYKASFTGSDNPMSDVRKIAELPFGVCDLSFNPVDHTMYGRANSNDELFKVNLSNGETTVIGSTNLNGSRRSIEAFAINAQGEAFGIAHDNNLYRVNLNDGSLTLVGNTGRDAFYYSTMAFDRSTGELFWSQLGQSSWGLYKVNTRTGATKLVSPMGDAKVTLQALFRIDPTCVGIGNAEDVAASVYPNPTNGVVNISASGLYRIEAMDITGRTVAVSNTGSVDLSAQPNGIYILRIVTDGGGTVSKVMKQ